MISSCPVCGADVEWDAPDNHADAPKDPTCSKCCTALIGCHSCEYTEEPEPDSWCENWLEVDKEKAVSP